MTAIKFESVPIKESNEPLENVAKFGLLYEPMYFNQRSPNDNNQRLSDDNRIFLRRTLIDKLLTIQNRLEIYGYKFKIWDGFRCVSYGRRNSGLAI